MLLINGVLSDGPAGIAGLQTDDVIVAADGEPIESFADFQSVVDRARPGEVLKLDLKRRSESLSVSVTLEPLPADGGNGRILAAAEAGEKWAMFELAMRYGGISTGKPYLEPNDRQAVDWMRRAAQAGSASASHFLAMWYNQGTKVTRDPVEALRWLEHGRPLVDEYDPLRLDLLYDAFLGAIYYGGVGTTADHVPRSRLPSPSGRCRRRRIDEHLRGHLSQRQRGAGRPRQSDGTLLKSG